MFKKIQAYLDKKYLPIDQMLEKPEELTPRMKERIRAVQCRYDFNKLAAYPHRKVLTAHDRVITPYRLEKSFRTNLLEFMCQPRITELRKQLQPLLKNGEPYLDIDTGNFYNSLDMQNPLGQIDVQTEYLLFKDAAQKIAFKKVFGDVSPENPIVIDMGSGLIYPKNNPQEIRGKASFSSTVFNPRAHKTSAEQVAKKDDSLLHIGPFTNPAHLLHENTKDSTAQHTQDKAANSHDPHDSGGSTGSSSGGMSGGPE